MNLFIVKLYVSSRHSALIMIKMNKVVMIMMLIMMTMITMITS